MRPDRGAGTRARGKHWNVRRAHPGERGVPAHGGGLIDAPRAPGSVDGISVVVPTYNRAALLDRALSTIANLVVSHGFRMEVLVVNNNSTDSTSRVVRRFRGGADREIKEIIETRQGLNHARNRGIREARYEHLVFVDDDSEIDPGWMESYIESHRRLRPHAVAGPVFPDFEHDPPGWIDERILDSITSAYSRKGDESRVLQGEEAHHLPGCNFAVLKSAAEEVGGFDPRLDRSGGSMLAGGDWEFAERLSTFGKKLVYVPGCRVRHFISVEKMSREGLRRRWEGLGATTSALEALRGQTRPYKRTLTLFLRLVRLYGRGSRYRALGDVNRAFATELEALRLRGMLFGCPPGIRDKVEPA